MARREIGVASPKEAWPGRDASLLYRPGAAGAPWGSAGVGGGPTAKTVREGGRGWGGGAVGFGVPQITDPPSPPQLMGLLGLGPPALGPDRFGGTDKTPLMGLLAPGLPLMGSVQCGDPRLGETSPLCPIAVPLAPHDCPIAVPTVPHSCPQRAPWMPHSCPIADAIVPHSCPPPPTPRAEEDRGGGGAFKAPSLPGPRAQWGCVGCGHGGQR